MQLGVTEWHLLGWRRSLEEQNPAAQTQNALSGKVPPPFRFMPGSGTLGGLRYICSRQVIAQKTPCQPRLVRNGWKLSAPCCLPCTGGCASVSSLIWTGKGWGRGVCGTASRAEWAHEMPGISLNCLSPEGGKEFNLTKVRGKE